MSKQKIIVIPALEKEIGTIEKIAKSLDLDCEDLSWNQFIVAKKDQKIIGIGRLREYSTCTEIATVGIVSNEQQKGIGRLIVEELIRIGPPEIFLTCVIPDFFNRLGFKLVKQYPSVLQKKVDFCKSYNFNDDQVFVMKLTKTNPSF